MILYLPVQSIVRLGTIKKYLIVFGFFPWGFSSSPSCGATAGGDAFALFYEAKTKKARPVVAEISWRNYASTKVKSSPFVQRSLNHLNIFALQEWITVSFLTRTGSTQMTHIPTQTHVRSVFLCIFFHFRNL